MSGLPPDSKKKAVFRKKSGALRVFILVVFVSYFKSLAFAQEGQFQSLISGMEHYRDGNYENALEDFQKALTIFPYDPDIPFYIGLT